MKLQIYVWFSPTTFPETGVFWTPNSCTAETQVKLKSVFIQESSRQSGIRPDFKDQAGQAGQRQARLMTALSLECRKVNNNVAGNHGIRGFYT